MRAASRPFAPVPVPGPDRDDPLGGDLLSEAAGPRGRQVRSGGGHPAHSVTARAGGRDATDRRDGPPAHRRPVSGPAPVSVRSAQACTVHGLLTSHVAALSTDFGESEVLLTSRYVCMYICMYLHAFAERNAKI